MRLKYMESMIKNSNTRKLTTVMKLGNVCNLENGKNITSSQFIDGEYPVIGGGKNYIGYHNEYNAAENTITIAKDGSCGIVLNHKTKTFITNHGLYVSMMNDKKVTLLYLYNYLLLIQESIKSYGKGASQQGLIKDDLLTKIDIPVPTIEFQKYMETPLNNFDKMDELLNKLLDDNNKYLEISFMNSLDDYGNPNAFNIHKLNLNESQSENLEQNETKEDNNINDVNDVKEEKSKKDKKIKKEKKSKNID
jgi:hypothetical protein